VLHLTFGLADVQLEKVGHSLRDCVEPILDAKHRRPPNLEIGEGHCGCDRYRQQQSHPDWETDLDRVEVRSAQVRKYVRDGAR
jgi:hypothetical protein